MTRMILGLLGLLAVIGLTSHAHAAPVRVVDRVEGWVIQDDGSGCVASSNFDNDVTMAVWGSADEKFIFTLQHKRWSIKDGAGYSLTIQFDNSSPWINVPAVGDTELDDDGPALAFMFSPQDNKDGDNFVVEFALARSMRVKKDGVIITHLDLTGTKAMILSLARCRNKYRRFDDPFEDITPDVAPPNKAGTI